MFSQAKDAIEKEIEDREVLRKEKKEENEIKETTEFMHMIGKQQEQLASLIKQTRVNNESKLELENQKLMERLVMLENLSQQRKMEMAMHTDTEDRKRHKKKRKDKHKKKRKNKHPHLPPLPFGPVYAEMPPNNMYGQNMMQNMMQPYGRQMNYPMYPNNGAGMMPGYGNMQGSQSYSALAGAGLNALNMPPHHDPYSHMNYYSQSKLPNVEFDDGARIMDGRDIDEENEQDLKALLAAQLGGNTQNKTDFRPPTHS